MYAIRSYYVSLSKTQFSSNEVGNQTVVLTVTDNHGNNSTCSATVTVIDNISPEVQCNTVDFVISSDSYYTLTDADIAALSSGTTDNVITSYSIHYTKLYECRTVFPRNCLKLDRYTW